MSVIIERNITVSEFIAVIKQNLTSTPLYLDPKITNGVVLGSASELNELRVSKGIEQFDEPIITSESSFKLLNEGAKAAVADVCDATFLLAMIEAHNLIDFNLSIDGASLDFTCTEPTPNRFTVVVKVFLIFLIIASISSVVVVRKNTTPQLVPADNHNSFINDIDALEDLEFIEESEAVLSRLESINIKNVD